MENVLKYLNEKQKYFYPEENKKIIYEEEIPNNSDPILNADEFMYSNSEIHDYYSKGSGFRVNDSQDFLEVIKLIKDLTDKHLFLKNMTWKADVKSKKLIVSFSVSEEENSDEVDNFFFNSIQQNLVANLLRKFDSLFKIDTEFINLDRRKIMRLIITK
jgi:hypothetical protein